MKPTHTTRYIIRHYVALGPCSASSACRPVFALLTSSLRGALEIVGQFIPVCCLISILIFLCHLIPCLVYCYFFGIFVRLKNVRNIQESTLGNQTSTKWTPFGKHRLALHPKSPSAYQPYSVSVHFNQPGHCIDDILLIPLELIFKTTVTLAEKHARLGVPETKLKQCLWS